MTNRRAGLASWSEPERQQRLDDAIQLLEAGLILRERDQAHYRDCFRRAAEILEWLAHPQTNPDRLPIRLLAAAVYQLSGYSARSSGLLNNDIASQPESPILQAYLRADFPTLLERLCGYWLRKREVAPNERIAENLNMDMLASRIQSLIVDETASCLGVFCMTMRWGDDRRLQKAVEKMRGITGLMDHSSSPYSWLLAKACTETAEEYLRCSLRRQLEGFQSRLSTDGQEATDRYTRSAYRDRKVIAWPSQAAGIEKLAPGTVVYSLHSNRVW